MLWWEAYLSSNLVALKFNNLYCRNDLTKCSSLPARPQGIVLENKVYKWKSSVALAYSSSFDRWFHFIQECRREITARMCLYVSSWIPETDTHTHYRSYIPQQKPITFVLLAISDKIKYILYLNKIFGSKYSILLIGMVFSCGNGADNHKLYKGIHTYIHTYEHTKH